MAKKPKHPVDKKKVYKLDLFNQVLPAIDTRDKEFYSRLSDEERKTLSPVVLMRCLSSVTKGYNKGDDVELTEYYIEALNETVNKIDVLSLYKHPELQWKLMSVIGCGKRVSHNFMPPTAKSKSTNLDELFKKRYPSIGRQELDTLLEVCTIDDIKELCEDFALDKKETKKYTDEFKKVKNGK